MYFIKTMQYITITIITIIIAIAILLIIFYLHTKGVFKNIPKRVTQKKKSEKKFQTTQKGKSEKKIQTTQKRKSEKKPKKYPKNMYMDMSIDKNGILLGTIRIKLFNDIVPKTCENFYKLSKKYEGCLFHRIIHEFMIQGGDFVNGDGTGGYSIYGGKFEDENFDIPHDRPYLLSMANSGPNTNGSQFFITTVATPHLDGKHVVFGEVTKGFDIIDILNSTETDSHDRPVEDINISNIKRVE